MTTALSLALTALEDAHARFLLTARLHVADLLVFGVSPEEAEEWLAPLDVIEAAQNELVQGIREMAA